MDLKKISLLFWLPLAFLLCSDKGNGPSSNPPASLAGTWVMESGDVDVYITSKTAQQAIDLPNPGTGAITVTGACHTSLTYFISRMADVIPFGVASASFLEIEDKPYPYYTFIVARFQNLVYGVFNAHYDSAAVDTFFIIGPGYQFDSTAYVLTLDNLVLNTGTGTKSVTLNGTLAARTIHLPALTQTFMSTIRDVLDDDETHTVIFNADSTFTRIVAGDTQADTFDGTWRTALDTLTMIDLIPAGPDTARDTTVYLYSLAGTKVTVTDVELRDFRDQTGLLYTHLELAYSLETGSIDTAVAGMKYNLAKQ